MNRHSTNPWARLRVLLMLPVVALSVIVASACKQDANSEMEVNSKDALPTSVYWDIEECEECGIEEADTSQVFMVVEEMPEFPGGTEALMEYLRSNIQYPERCKENKIQGRVLISFVVNKDGSIVEPAVVKSAGPEGVELDFEASRVISSMPAWTPGKQKGEAVRVRFTVPVNFRLSED